MLVAVYDEAESIEAVKQFMKEMIKMTFQL